MKKLNKLISSVVLVCFVWNTAVQDYALALSPMPGSTQPDTQAAMYAAAQKKWATTEYGPGSGISEMMDKYTPAEFMGDVPGVEGLKFVRAEGIPEGWEWNGLLRSDPNNIIDAFKYFRDHEARLNRRQIEIVEGDFKLENVDSGEIPICRLEQNPVNKKYKLVIHKDFVRMWANIKKNDVRFEYRFPDGKVRTISVAWAIFYRIAKHEMSDMTMNRRYRAYNPKSHGHLEFIPPFGGFFDMIGVNESDITANLIKGRYAIVNDAIWAWFLGSYAFGPSTQYSDSTFEARTRWFLGLYEGPNAEKWNRWAIENNLQDEFPNLHNKENRETAISIARAVNKEFYSKYTKNEIPKLLTGKISMDEELAAGIVLREKIGGIDMFREIMDANLIESHVIPRLEELLNDSDIAVKVHAKNMLRIMKERVTMLRGRAEKEPAPKAVVPSSGASSEALKDIMAGMKVAMNNGLNGLPSSLKMIPAYVGAATGEEEGDYYAIDVGGTNLRVLGVHLEKGKKPSLIGNIEKAEIPGSIIHGGTAKELFDFIANTIKEYTGKNGIDPKADMKFGITWSFPVKQTGIASGIHLEWTKGWDISGVVGEDPVMLLNAALARGNFTNVKIMAMCNDTVGTLMFGDVGLILGTGTNAAFTVPVKDIGKFKEQTNIEAMAINMEWGNFDGVPTREWDALLDKLSNNPGRQKLEKMISGMYLGEMARHMINAIVSEGQLFAGKKYPVFENMPTGSGKNEFTAELMSRIETVDSALDPELNGVKDILASIGVTDTTLSDRRNVRDICNTISKRAARVSAAALASVIKKSGLLDKKEICRVAIDGSVFKLYHGFKENMEAALVEIFGAKDGARIQLVGAEDGSGIGAAIIAAVVDGSEKTSKTAGLAAGIVLREKIGGIDMFREIMDANLIESHVIPRLEELLNDSDIAVKVHAKNMLRIMKERVVMLRGWAENDILKLAASVTDFVNMKEPSLYTVRKLSDTRYEIMKGTIGGILEKAGEKWTWGMHSGGLNDDPTGAHAFAEIGYKTMAPKAYAHAQEFRKIADKVMEASDDVIVNITPEQLTDIATCILVSEIPPEKDAASTIGNAIYTRINRGKAELAKRGVLSAKARKVIGARNDAYEKYLAFMLAIIRPSSEQAVGRGKPGRNADSAFNVIANSAILQTCIEAYGYMTLKDYRAGYDEVRGRFGFAALPEKIENDTTSRGDLEKLVDAGRLEIVIDPVTGKPYKEYRYRLTGLGQFDMDFYNADIAYSKIPVTGDEAHQDTILKVIASSESMQRILDDSPFGLGYLPKDNTVAVSDVVNAYEQIWKLNRENGLKLPELSAKPGEQVLRILESMLSEDIVTIRGFAPEYHLTVEGRKRLEAIKAFGEKAVDMDIVLTVIANSQYLDKVIKAYSSGRFTLDDLSVGYGQLKAQSYNNKLELPDLDDGPAIFGMMLKRAADKGLLAISYTPRFALTEKGEAMVAAAKEAFKTPALSAADRHAERHGSEMDFPEDAVMSIQQAAVPVIKVLEEAARKNKFDDTRSIVENIILFEGDISAPAIKEIVKEAVKSQLTVLDTTKFLLDKLLSLSGDRAIEIITEVLDVAAQNAASGGNVHVEFLISKLIARQDRRIIEEAINIAKWYEFNSALEVLSDKLNEIDRKSVTVGRMERLVTNLRSRFVKKPVTGMTGYVHANLKDLESSLPERVNIESVEKALVKWLEQNKTEQATAIAREDLLAMGVPETTIAKLFQPFFTGSIPAATTTSNLHTDEQIGDWVIRDIANTNYTTEAESVDYIVNYLIDEGGPRELSIIMEELVGNQDERLNKVFESLLKRLDKDKLKPRDPWLTKEFISTMIRKARAYSASDLTIEEINTKFTRPKFIPETANLTKIYGEVGNYVVCRYGTKTHYIAVYDKSSGNVPEWFTRERNYPLKYNDSTKVRLYKEQGLIAVYNTERTGWDENGGLSEHFLLCDAKAGRVVVDDGAAASYLGPKSFIMAVGKDYCVLLHRGVNSNTRYVDKNQQGREAYAGFDVYRLTGKRALHSLNSYDFSRERLSDLEDLKIVDGHYLLIEYLKEAYFDELYDIGELLKGDFLPKPIDEKAIRAKTAADRHAERHGSEMDFPEDAAALKSPETAISGADGLHSALLLMADSYDYSPEARAIASAALMANGDSSQWENLDNLALSGYSEESKAIALAALLAYGEESAKEKLSILTLSQSEKTRVIALAALLTSGDYSVTSELDDLTMFSNPEDVRAIAVATMMKNGRGSAREYLDYLTIPECSSETRAVAFAALLDSGEESARKELEGLIRTGCPAVARAIAIAALFRNEKVSAGANQKASAETASKVKAAQLNEKLIVNTLPQPRIVQEKYNVWTLSDDAGNEFKVTDFGANVVSMKMSGQELLWHETNGETVRQDNGLAVRGGMPFMFPWTSRIENGTLALQDGRTIDLKKFPYVRKVPGAVSAENVLHGMTDKIQWKVIGGENDRIILAVKLRDVKIGVDGIDNLAEVFGDVEVRITHSFFGDRFASVVEVVNLGDKPAELSFGFHPFYRLGETLEGWSAVTPATEYWKTDSAQVPLKQKPASVIGTEYDLRSPKPLDRAYEVGLTGLKPDFRDNTSSKFTHKDGRVIEISQRGIYDNIMFWVPFGNPNLPAGIASFQPTTSSANAINMSRAGITEAKPVNIAPGESEFAVWSLKYSAAKAPVVSEMSAADRHAERHGSEMDFSEDAVISKSSANIEYLKSVALKKEMPGLSVVAAASVYEHGAEADKPEMANILKKLTKSPYRGVAIDAQIALIDLGIDEATYAVELTELLKNGLYPPQEIAVRAALVRYAGRKTPESEQGEKKSAPAPASELNEESSKSKKTPHDSLMEFLNSRSYTPSIWPVEEVVALEDMECSDVATYNIITAFDKVGKIAVWQRVPGAESKKIFDIGVEDARENVASGNIRLRRDQKFYWKDGVPFPQSATLVENPAGKTGELDGTPEAVRELLGKGSVEPVATEYIGNVAPATEAEAKAGAKEVDDAIAATVKRARTSAESEAKSIPDVIDEYGAPIARGYGPGVLTPSPTEIASFYPAINMLETTRVEIYLSSATRGTITRSVKDEISRINSVIRDRVRKHAGREGNTPDAITILSYDSNNLDKCLDRKGSGDNVKRVFVMNDEKTAKLFNDRLDTSAGIGLLKGNRLFRVDIQAGKNEIEDTVHQAWLLKVAILSGLVTEENMYNVGQALMAEVKGRLPLGYKDASEFALYMAKPENDTTSTEAVSERVWYFLNATVAVSVFIGEQLRILKAFWTAA